MIEHDRLRVYVLSGLYTVLAWCRDKQNTWQSELQDGHKPETLRNVEINLAAALANRRAKSARIYDPWTDRWSPAKIRHAMVTVTQLSRSAVVRVLI